MYKATTLLKVVSILLIIGGVFGVISSMASKMILEWSQQVSGMDLGVEVTALDMVLGVISSAVSLVAGVLALMSKQYKTALILMAVYVAYLVYNLIVSVQMIGFNALSMVSFIIPALYFWGLYTSKIDELEENEGEVAE